MRIRGFRSGRNKAIAFAKAGHPCRIGLSRRIKLRGLVEAKREKFLLVRQLWHNGANGRRSFPLRMVAGTAGGLQELLTMRAEEIGQRCRLIQR